MSQRAQPHSESRADSPAQAQARGTDEPLTYIGLNLFSRTFRRDPYPFYAQLREGAPIVWDPKIGFWIVSRYRDVVEILRDHERFSNVHAWEKTARASVWKRQRGWILYSDPPVHTQGRHLILRAIKQCRRDLQTLVTRLSDEIVNEAIAKGQVDIVAEVAEKVPVAVVSELMALPQECRPELVQLTRRVSRLLEPLLAKQVIEDGERAMIAIGELLHERVRQCKASPGTDLVSEILRLSGGNVSDEDIVNNCIFLLGAAFETTAYSLGAGLVQLVASQEQITLLRQRPELIPCAVEEILRYDSPVQITTRVVSEPGCVHRDKELRAGQEVMVLLGAANRDPDCFDEPDIFDVTRGQNHHVAFGSGIHACLGASIGREQIASVLRALFRGTRAIEIDTRRAIRHLGVVLRGYESLPTQLIPTT